MKITLTRTEEPDGNWLKIKADGWTQKCFTFNKENEQSRLADALEYFNKFVEDYKTKKSIIIKDIEL